MTERQILRGGRYVVMGVLGEGSQGATLEAVDKRDGRLVAIKRFDVRGAKSWKDVELAEREARVLASLSHPSLPAYIEHFEESGVLYLAMEKIEGTSIGARLRGGEGFSEADVQRLLEDAAEALAYLHGRGVVHRDLKPGNVIRRPNGSYAFVDFGAVRDRMKPHGGSTVVGTFGYMAPEQFQGRAAPASDVYAVGATALAMLTGREPEELPHRGLAIDVASALRGRASDTMIRALGQALEPDPDRRAASLGELVAEMARASAAKGRSRSAGRAPVASSVNSDSHPRWTREDRRARRREERHARRAARRARRSRAPVGPLIMWPIFVALAVARIVVSVVLRVLVPLLLTLLSVVLGRPLRLAAERVSRAGERAYDALDRAAGGRIERDDERIRVGPVGAGETEQQVRVPTATPSQEEALDEDSQDDDEPARRRRV
jgi:hypothetical protein